MVAVSLPGVVRCPLVVGRDAELAAISALLDAVGSGSGGALMLDADAGLGKSRLVAEAVVRARAAGIQIAAGRASASAAVPYRVLSEALVAMTGRQGPPDDRRIDPYRPVLGRLAPGWPSEAEPADMSAERHTARLVNSEHTEEDRDVPARQHTGMSRSAFGPDRSLPDNIRRYARLLGARTHLV